MDLNDRRSLIETIIAIGMACALWAPAAAAQAPASVPTYTVLHSFVGAPTDGADPVAALVRDSSGNLYGTTNEGGPSAGGVVFRLSSTDTETFLHKFTGAQDGGSLQAGLTRDAAGNLYGTAFQGGSGSCFGGCGVVFKLSPAGKETVLHAFTGGADGASPEGGVIRDAAGNLYGTTVAGGGSCTTGCGLVFKLSPAGAETVLHTFTVGADGTFPEAGVIRDSAGNLYGTTESGGAFGFGVVFKLSPDGTETVLYNFTGRSDGARPFAGVIRDSAGNLYGTTAFGGSFDVCINGCGVAFKLSPTGTETVLHSFTGGTDGAEPFAGLIRDAAGNLFGTASGDQTSGSGVIFKISPTGTETVLHSFTGGADGGEPLSGLIADSAGNLYGTTAFGGNLNACVDGCGVVFKLSR